MVAEVAGPRMWSIREIKKDNILPLNVEMCLGNTFSIFDIEIRGVSGIIALKLRIVAKNISEINSVTDWELDLTIIAHSQTIKPD
jgi:hypothetical protein